MPDTPVSNDPRNPGPAADNRVGRAAAAASSPPPRGAAQPSQQPAQGADAAHVALDQFHDAHMRNSPLSQRTDLYNEAAGHIRALKELLSTAHGSSGAATQRQQTAENQDAFVPGGSNNANV